MTASQRGEGAWPPSDDRGDRAWLASCRGGVTAIVCPHAVNACAPSSGRQPDVADQRSKFAGGDQAYLRDEQYRTSDRLARRANLHAKHSTAAVRWPDWIAARLELAPGSEVLEVGC